MDNEIGDSTTGDPGGDEVGARAKGDRLDDVNDQLSGLRLEVGLTGGRLSPSVHTTPNKIRGSPQAPSSPNHRAREPPHISW